MKKFLSLILIICIFAGIAIPANAASYRYEDLKYDIVHHPYITPDEMIDNSGEWVTGILGHANYCTIEHKFFATNSPKCPYCGETGWIGEKCLLTAIRLSASIFMTMPLRSKSAV